MVGEDLRDPIEFSVDEDDIQSLVFSGYSKLEAARFVLFEVCDRKKAGRWLGELPVPLRTGRVPKQRESDPAVNLALTAAGLRKLGIDEQTLSGFSAPFLEGMVPGPCGDERQPADDANRCRRLGDLGANHPRDWEWGGALAGAASDAGPAGETGLQKVHGLLLLFAGSESGLQKLLDSLVLRDSGDPANRANDLSGCRFHFLPHPQALHGPPQLRKGGGPFGLKEHFGFDDGIGNPVIHWRPEGPKAVLSHNRIAPGEILLGYPDQDGRLPPSPRISPGAPAAGALPNGDLGRNGSYLVVRQLEQHVGAFWRFLRKHAGNPAEAIRLAAKLVGRWPNGAPLARWPNSQPASDRLQDDDFLYGADPQGHACPLGAHIRRANPRDALSPEKPQDSIETSRRRRILRRGRSYGEPFAGWPDLEKVIIEAQRGAAEDRWRGIHFLCLNSDIEAQFEFIQHDWLLSRKFAGLRNDADPLLSNPDCPRPGVPSDFTLQEPPVARRIRSLERFVRVRGGAYFFLPGRRALGYIAGTARSAPDPPR